MRPRSWPQKVFPVASIVLTLAAVVWFYHWTVRTSGGFEKPGEEDYYNFLVQGWRQGHLHMSKEPRPELLALADPYDPAQNAAVRLGDASYFRGHNYLYFGAAPAALLLWPYAVLTGGELGTTTAIFIFSVIGFLAASGLWLAIRRRYFPASAAWVGVAGVLMLGLATHVLALERRPFVWELPIAAAFAFMMLAFVGLYRALVGPRPELALGLAGLSLGLAVGSRPTCVLGALMFLPPLLHLRRAAPQKTLWRRGALAAAAGLGVCLLALASHNIARFGNPFEFGQGFQLSGVYESKMQHFRFAYLAHNFSIYYLHLPEWTREFPFVSATAVTAPGPAGYLGGWNEPICGLAVTLPFLWLALASPLAWRKQNDGATWDRAPLRALLLSVAIFYGVMTAVILGYFVATPRYLADFTPALALLAAVGLLARERWATPSRTRNIALPFAAAACGVTALAGVLLSFDDHQRATRPRWANVEKFFSARADLSR